MTDLSHLSILLLRPKNADNQITQALQKFHARLVYCPTIEIAPTSLDWLEHLPSLSTIQHAIFTSPNAVEFTFLGLKTKNILWPDSIFITTIGKGTAAALKRLGIKVHFIPAIETSEHLLALTHLQNIENQIILLFKGEGGRDLIEKTCRQRSAQLTIVSVYERRMPRTRPLFIWEKEKIQVILITSETGIKHFFALYPASHDQERIKNLTCIVISERLAKIVQDLGFKTILISSLHNLVNTLQALPRK